MFVVDIGIEETGYGVEVNAAEGIAAAVAIDKVKT